MIDFIREIPEEVFNSRNSFYCNKDCGNFIAIILKGIMEKKQTAVLHVTKFRKSSSTLYQMVLGGWKWLIENDNNKTEWARLRNRCKIRKTQDAVYIIYKEEEAFYSEQPEGTCPVRLFIEIQPELEQLGNGTDSIVRSNLNLTSEGIERLTTLLKDALPESAVFKITPESLVITNKI